MRIEKEIRKKDVKKKELTVSFTDNRFVCRKLSYNPHMQYNN
jgi:hypothetical protein